MSMLGVPKRMMGAIVVAVLISIASLGIEVAQSNSESAKPNAAESEKGFTPLFNGKDLTGWHVIGTPSWEVRDGILVCTGKGGGWLRTDKQYENFVLRLEYKIRKRGNSGIFIRAAKRGNPAYTGMEVQILDSYGHKPKPHTAGAIYGAVAPKKEASKPAGKWNQVEITCRGPWVIVVLNGEKIIEVNMDKHPKLKGRLRKGYIGLQNHGHHVEFRNIRIKILSTPAKGRAMGFKPLFNGKDLSGWHIRGAKSWQVRDGILVCTGRGGGLLLTDKQYENFILRLDYKLSKGGNSGVYLRTDGTHLEVQILDSYGREPTSRTAGAIYGVIAPKREASKPAGEWNHLEIICWGPWVVVALNWVEIIRANMDEYPQLKNRARKGYIGLQNHGSRVEFRNIYIKELPSTS